MTKVISPAKLTAPFGGFRALPGPAFMAERGPVADAVGVYAIFLRDAGPLLSRSGYDAARDGVPAYVGDHVHIYTGESWGVRSRVGAHVRGNIVESNLRETLLAMQMEHGAIRGGPDVASNLLAAETWLTGWLADRVIVGFRLGGFVVDIERKILGSTASPLNIAGRSNRPFARELTAARRSFRNRPEVIEARKQIRAASGADAQINRHRRR